MKQNTQQKILIINVCKHELHYFEFVKPVEDIVVKAGFECNIVHINHFDRKHLDSSDKIIICGTSLRDFDYEKKDFLWIKLCTKPILGICAGFQIICKLYGQKTLKGLDIGLKEVFFEKEFLGLKDNKQVYCLHNNIIITNNKFGEKCEVYDNSKYIQAIKMYSKHIYATLFHPEVRNKTIIENFLYI